MSELTKEFFQQQSQAAKEAMRKAETDYNRNKGMVEFCEVVIERFFKEEVKEK